MGGVVIGCGPNLDPDCWLVGLLARGLLACGCCSLFIMFAFCDLF